jgi:UDP-N-acetylglucosamine 1-carboxyvinyltransferase
MAASLLASGRTTIERVPRIRDCETMGEVLQHLGAEVTWDADTVAIDTTNVNSVETPYELVRQMRASIIVLGPLLARYGRARVAMPGGCNIGARGIDLHIRGLERLGATFEHEHGYLEVRAPKLNGTMVTLDFPSVGATENLMMASVGAFGTTVIENAAREPEIVDLAEFLRSMGAEIGGHGTTTIEIEGVREFHPTRHRVIPDRVEAGTFAIAACATRGDVFLEDARADHLDIPLSKLDEAGARIRTEAGGISVRMDDRPRSVDVITLPYPGFPTDLQPQIMAMLAVADGPGSIVTENVFESRFMFVDELKRMGADIRTEGHHGVIRGVESLSAAPVRALDIRAGAAVVIAALIADGTTEISNVYHVDRGYEGLDQKLIALGASVRRTQERSPAYT